MRRFNRKSIVVTAVASLGIAGAGLAFAYWSAGGSGTGSAAAGSSSAITVVQTSTVEAMAPGAAPQSLAGNFNNTNTGPVHVNTVTASIASVFQGGVVAVGCDATDYTLTGAVMPAVQDVPGGTAQGAWSGATIEFNNKETNQDACKGAVVNLAYAVS